MPGSHPVRFALAYFAAVFALGFVLGTARTLWLVPSWGAVPAVLAELPVMLGFSAWWSRRLLRRWPLPRPVALLAGSLALALLLGAELGFAVLVGETPALWLASLATPAGALGLAGQIAFGVMPAGRRRPGDVPQER